MPAPAPTAYGGGGGDGGGGEGGEANTGGDKAGGLFEASAADNSNPSAVSQALAVLDVAEFLVSALLASAVLFCVAAVA